MLHHVWACAAVAHSLIGQKIKTTTKPTLMWPQWIQETPGLFYRVITRSITSGQRSDISNPVQRNHAFRWSGPLVTTHFGSRNTKDVRLGLSVRPRRHWFLYGIDAKGQRHLLVFPGTHALFISAQSLHTFRSRVISFTHLTSLNIQIITYSCAFICFTSLIIWENHAHSKSLS